MTQELNTCKDVEYHLCLPYNCGGGALEQVGMRYDGGSRDPVGTSTLGPHPKCNNYPSTFQVNVSNGYVGTMEEVSPNYITTGMRSKFGCNHVNCICPHSLSPGECFSIGKHGVGPLQGHNISYGSMTEASCAQRGQCKSDWGGGKFGSGLSGPERQGGPLDKVNWDSGECYCRGMNWSTFWIPYTQDEKKCGMWPQASTTGNNLFTRHSNITGVLSPNYSPCVQCQSTCGTTLADKNADPNCNVSWYDCDGYKCCCEEDVPLCDLDGNGECFYGCTMWQGSISTTCGPPIFYGIGNTSQDADNGYGATIPYTFTLVCSGAGLEKDSYLHGDYGIWKLEVQAWRPDCSDRLGSTLCKEYMFENINGKNRSADNFLEIAGFCESGPARFQVTLPGDELGDDRCTFGCGCECGCEEQVSHADCGLECNCLDPDCQSDEGNECIHGSSDPPECDASCFGGNSCCPGADLMAESMICCGRDGEPPCPDVCTKGGDSDGATGGGGPAGGAGGTGGGTGGIGGGGGGGGGGSAPCPVPELMGNISMPPGIEGECCKWCTAGCQDACVCMKKDCLVGPPSQCGIIAHTYYNQGGHGAYKAPVDEWLDDDGNPTCPKPYTVGEAEGACIKDDCEFACGCVAEGAGDIIVSIIPNIDFTVVYHEPRIVQFDTPQGPEEAVEYDNPHALGTPNGFCDTVDICDQQQKFGMTQGCKYTYYPSGCETALPSPNHTKGVRCPNSQVYKQPEWGWQCALPGGSANGPENWDFPIKGHNCIGADVSGKHWHLRPQKVYPYLWKVCYPTGDDFQNPTGKICDSSADATCPAGVADDDCIPLSDLECAWHPLVPQLVADIGNEHSEDSISECNIYCEGFWEVVVDCQRAGELGLCKCTCDCFQDRVDAGFSGCCSPVGTDLYCTCDEASQSNDIGCDGKWPGYFPFLYYWPADPRFCPHGEYWPAVGCPVVPGSIRDDMGFAVGGATQWEPTDDHYYCDPGAPCFRPVINVNIPQTNQLYYPGNLESKWTSCCGNQPGELVSRAVPKYFDVIGHGMTRGHGSTTESAGIVGGCECCYPCGHPAYDPWCRLRGLLTGRICDVCWECACDAKQRFDGGKIYDERDCPTPCTHGRIQGIDDPARTIYIEKLDDNGHAAFMSACIADPAMIALHPPPGASASTITECINGECWWDWVAYPDGGGIYVPDNLNTCVGDCCCNEQLPRDLFKGMRVETECSVCASAGGFVGPPGASASACEAEFLLPMYELNGRQVWPGWSADINTTEDSTLAGLVQSGIATMEPFEGDMGDAAGTEGWSSAGGCHQVVQDGGNEIAGCGQFMQLMPEMCEWPIFCPEGLVEHSPYGGGFCIEGDSCCASCGPRTVETVGVAVGGVPTAGWKQNQLGWKIGAAKEYDRVWNHLRDVVCHLEPCGMGASPFYEERRGDTLAIIDSSTPKASFTFMAEGTTFYISEGENIPSRLVGKSTGVQRLEDKVDSGWIYSTSGLDIGPIRIKTYLENNQTSHNLKVGDKVYIGAIFDSYQNQTGSEVEGNTQANGMHSVVAIDPPLPNGDVDTFYVNGTGNGAYEKGGRWFALDLNGANYDGGNSFEIQTSTKAGYVTEDLFIGLVEEAFAEWSDIIENLWSTHADFTDYGVGVTVTESNGGSWTPHSTRVMGKWDANGTSNSLGYSSSHDLKVRFINMGHEPLIAANVPVKIGERYVVGDFREYTDDPIFGTCSNNKYTNKADCITNGQLYENGCSANDNRARQQFPVSYNNPTDCWGATVSYCWDKTDGRVIPHPINELECAAALQNNNDHEGRWIENEIGTFGKDYGVGSGIFNPGVKKVYACVPKDGECCNGVWSYDTEWSCDPTYTDQTRSSDHWIKPTNDYTPRACAKEVVESNGACVGQPFVQWNNTAGYILSQCEYDCCGYGEAGWCMNQNGAKLWDSDTYLGSRQGVLQCRDPEHGGSASNVWVGASWSSAYTWELNSWTSNASFNVRHYGNTGGKCSKWPKREECCPRIGTIRVGMGDLGPIQVVGSQQNPIPITDNLTISYQLSTCDPAIGGVTCMRPDPAGTGEWIPCIPEKPYQNAHNSTPFLPDSYHPRDDNEALEKHTAAWEKYKTGPMTCVDGDNGEIRCHGEVIPGANCVGFASTTDWDKNWDHIAAHPDEPPIRPEDSTGDDCFCISWGLNGKGGDLMINSTVDWRPDYVPESADPGAYSIKRALMYEIGLMLGLRPNVPINADTNYENGLHKHGAFSNTLPVRDIMTPVVAPDDNFDDISTNYRNTYQQLVELYELRHWDRGGLNDYTWGSGLYAGFFKSTGGGDEDWTKKVSLQNYTR